MNLLFIRCPPPAQLAEALKQHSVGIREAAAPETTPDAEVEVLIWKVEKDTELSELKPLRKRFENAWIAIIVPDRWLKDSKAYSTLLAAQEKDDVWLESSWESGFWLNLQRAVQSQASKKREKTLQDELDAIKEAQEKLMASSQELVEKLETDASLAAKVHERFYPRFSPDVPGVQVLSKYLPASGTGGDYFDLFEMGDKRRFGILLADASSHKVAAHLLSVLLKVRLDDLRGPFSDSSHFMQHLNDAVMAEHPNAGASLNLAYGVFDRSTLQLDLTCAGPLVPWVGKVDGWERLAVPVNPPIVAGSATWKSVSVQLTPGDRILLNTDGLSSALPDIESVLNAVGSRSEPHELRHHLLTEVDRRSSKTPLDDDITFIVLAVDAKALFIRPATPLKPQSK